MPKLSLGFKPWIVCKYALGTSWSLAHHGKYPCRNGFRVLCPDGKVRAVTEVGTSFDFRRGYRRAGVTFKGKFINGYVRTEKVDGKPTVVFKPLNRKAFQ